MIRALKRMMAWRAVVQDLRDGLAFASYAQEGEDGILRRLLEDLPGSGFYVDVGAHHPKRFSTTYAFYARGWAGINIDAAPGSMEPFRQVRPRDVNLEVGVSAEGGTLTFHVFNEGALSTFDGEVARQRSTGRYRVERRVQVQTQPLREILERHLPPGQEIAFLNVDVEGLDLEVLRSNDWARFRPRLVLVEQHLSMEDVPASPTARFLAGHGYALAARTLLTSIFRRGEPATTQPLHGRA